MVACILCALSCGLLPCECAAESAPSCSSLLHRFLPEFFHFGCSSCEKFHRRFELGQQLGRGSSGVTRLCTEKSTGEKLACKTISKQQEQACLEAELMRQVSGHPNIINLRDAYCCSNNAHLVMELCQEGSLMKRLIKDRTPYTEAQAAALCKSLMEAVQFCHSKGIVHRDITLANILICGSSGPKLADFGLATRVQPGGRLSKLVGTTYFVAPEVLRGDYSKEVDVWSAGIVLYAVLSGGEVPFSGKTTKGTFSEIMSKPVSFSSIAWRRASPLARDLLLGMLCREVDKRLTPAEVLNHEWIVQHSTGSLLFPSTATCIPNRSGIVAMDSSQCSTCSFALSQHALSSTDLSALKLGEELFMACKLLLAVLFSIKNRQ